MTAVMIILQMTYTNNKSLHCMSNIINLSILFQLTVTYIVRCSN